MRLFKLIGRFALAMWRLMEIPEPPFRAALVVRLATGIPVAVVLVLCLLQARDWQTGIRSRMGMELLDSANTIRMIGLSLVVFAVLVLVSYVLQWLFDRVRFRLYRYMPPRTANVAGFLLTWMNEEPAPDVSPDLQFIPIVTQFQLAVDLVLANTAPAGHGHVYYGPDYVDPWVAVTAQDNWTAEDTARLIAHCDGGFGMGCDNGRSSATAGDAGQD